MKCPKSEPHPLFFFRFLYNLLISYRRSTKLATITQRPRKDGGVSWRVQLHIKNEGKLVLQDARTFHLKHNAEKWAKAREIEVNTPGDSETPGNRGVSLKQLLGAYIDDPAVRIGYAKKSHLKSLQGTPLAEVELTSLGQSQIIEHVRDRIDGGDQSVAVNNDLIWLRTVAQWAQPFEEYPISTEEVENALIYCRLSGYIARTQMRARRPTADELWRLSDYFAQENDQPALPMRDIIWFAVHSARRLTEITQILWSKNDYDNRTGVMRDAKTNDNTRFKYTEAAWDIAQRQPRTDLRIFPYDPELVGTAFTSACHLLGIHDLRIHDLRHEATCRLFEAKYSLPAIKQIPLIHDWKTLGEYTHLKATDTPARVITHRELA